MFNFKTQNGQNSSSQQKKWRSFFRKASAQTAPNQAHKEEPGKKRFESIYSSKAYWADTSARIVFYVPALRLVEKYAAGMENDQILRSFGMALAINVVAGRLHGKVRELVSKALKIGDQSSKRKKTASDILAGIVVGIATYVPVLLFAKASQLQSSIAFPLVMGITLATGRYFGIFLDFWRKKFGTTPVFEKKEGESAGP